MAFIKIISFIWYFVLFIITVLLVVEYNFFKKQVDYVYQAKRNNDSLYYYLKKLVKYNESLNIELRNKVNSLVVNNKVVSNNLKSDNKKIDNIVNNPWKRFQKKGIFQWPIKSNQFWISSLYGPRKKANGSLGFHYGIDMAAIKGTAVFAALSGVVVESGYNKGYGKTIVIQHDYRFNNRIFKTRYAHLNKILIKLNQKVKTYQKIGEVGDTGFVRKSGRDASHLHFEIYMNNKRINPFYFLA